ncbi:MAG: DUF4388 domain-containing protein [Acidobacteriota bacterium]|jgi:hypothetical protein|nr:DUF4388 domain-containing protein [Acidobacteriota bacterium]
MTDLPSLSGRLNEVSLPRVLHQMARESIDGALRIDADDGGVTVHVQDGRVCRACPHPEALPIDKWLEKKGIISASDELTRARELMSAESIPFGRAMLKLELWDPETFWQWESGYQLYHIYRCFDCATGSYGVTTGTHTAPPGVTLDLSLHAVIVEGIRGMQNTDIIRRELAGVNALFVEKKRLETDPELKPHENHVLQLLLQHNDIESVIRHSLLPLAHTQRVLFLLLAAERVSTRRPEEKSLPQRPRVAASPGSFTSFEDALNHYNQKYVMVFRVLSKEIGPIALSILQKAVSGICDNLPAGLKRAQLREGGGLEEEPVLKSVWYQDFERTIGEFLRGLEEILYAQVYAVKHHLGVEVEQQILQWLNRNGN